jgi:hypothetical protein
MPDIMDHATEPNAAGAAVSVPRKPGHIALANSLIVINTGGRATHDKPTVTLETPRDPDRSAAFLISASPFLTPLKVM